MQTGLPTLPKAARDARQIASGQINACVEARWPHVVKDQSKDLIYPFLSSNNLTMKPAVVACIACVIGVPALIIGLVASSLGRLQTHEVGLVDRANGLRCYCNRQCKVRAPSTESSLPLLRWESSMTLFGKSWATTYSTRDFTWDLRVSSGSFFHQFSKPSNFLTLLVCPILILKAVLCLPFSSNFLQFLLLQPSVRTVPLFNSTSHTSTGLFPPLMGFFRHNCTLSSLLRSDKFHEKAANSPGI